MKILCFLFLTTFTLGCSSLAKLQQKGSLVPDEFRDSVSFTTYKGVILLPVQTKIGTNSFLFDTGAQLNAIQNEKPNSKRTVTVVGASKREKELPIEFTESLKIGEVEFINSTSFIEDFDGLKQQIPNFGGLIGQSVISKANWKIDYPNQVLAFSNQDLSEESFQTIDINRENGSPHVILKIDELEYECMIDLGSSTPGIDIPEDHPLAKQLLDQYVFEERMREIYSIGGFQQVKEKVSTLKKVELANMEFKNVPVSIKVSSQLRIGMQFFKDCILIIDNLNGAYKLKKIK